MNLINLQEALIKPEILTDFEGIKLRSNWQFNFTGWQLIQNYRHKDDCAIHEAEPLDYLDIDEACNCNPETYYVFCAKILAWPVGEPKREYHYCNLLEYPTDIRLMKTTPEIFVNEQDDLKLAALINRTPIKDWPLILWEDLQNGIATIQHFLKYNEATGRVLIDIMDLTDEQLDIIYERK